jgi:methionine aminopeptidase
MSKQLMTFDDHILWAFLDIASEEGSAEITDALEDGWTILSKNGDWSAQWEHTVLVTEHGAEILTSC